LQWQFDHPGCTKDEVLAAMKQNKAGFTSADK
jgi:hypothetical protein